MKQLHAVARRFLPALARHTPLLPGADQVAYVDNADVKNSAFAHAPSGHFQANTAWLALAALAHNLTRAAGALAGTFHARATTTTIRYHLINVPARLARSARRLTLHLPERWPWSTDFTQLFSSVHAPPAL